MQVRSFIPSSSQVEHLESSINEKFDFPEYFFIQSIHEFYWDNEVKWFIFLENEELACTRKIPKKTWESFTNEVKNRINNNSKYKEIVYKPMQNGSDFLSIDFLEFAGHGYPVHSQELWMTED